MPSDRIHRPRGTGLIWTVLIWTVLLVAGCGAASPRMTTSDSNAPEKKANEAGVAESEARATSGFVRRVTVTRRGQEFTTDDGKSLWMVPSDLRDLPEGETAEVVEYSFGGGQKPIPLSIEKYEMMKQAGLLN